MFSNSSSPVTKSDTKHPEGWLNKRLEFVRASWRKEYRQGNILSSSVGWVSGDWRTSCRTRIAIKSETPTSFNGNRVIGWTIFELVNHRCDSSLANVRFIKDRMYLFSYLNKLMENIDFFGKGLFLIYNFNLESLHILFLAIWYINIPQKNYFYKKLINL